MSELEVIGRLWCSDHHAIKPFMVFERSELVEAESFHVEANHFLEAVGGARDAQCRLHVHYLFACRNRER
jgi:hypothetical protein